MPVMLGMGLPLFPDKLCIAVCGRAGASKFLEVRDFMLFPLSWPAFHFQGVRKHLPDAPLHTVCH